MIVEIRVWLKYTAHPSKFCAPYACEPRVSLAEENPKRNEDKTKYPIDCTNATAASAYFPRKMPAKAKFARGFSSCKMRPILRGIIIRRTSFIQAENDFYILE